MIKTYKYRLMPTKSQLNKMFQTLEGCRWLYNNTLAFRRDKWEQEQQSVSLYETHNRIIELKREKPQLNNIHSQVLQQVCTRIELAYQAFFRRVKNGEEPGYPRFKKFGRYDSFTFTQTGFKLNNEKQVVKLSKIGDVPVILHRPIKGEIKTLTVHRSSTGKWYACFTVETEPERLPKVDNAIGIDVGLKTFATLSDGQEIENPRFFRTREKHLAKVQRKLSKYEKGTKERRHYRKAVAHTHERTRFKRQNFAHQQSRKIVNQFGKIAVEDLRINRMVQNHCLAKSISDAAWSEFFNMIACKAAEASRLFVAVNPAYTSQTCNKCHYRLSGKETLKLDNRVFKCPCCCLVLDRDLNAALNIKAIGLDSVGLSLDAPSFSYGE